MIESPYRAILEKLYIKKSGYLSITGFFNIYEVNFTRS